MQKLFKDLGSTVSQPFYHPQTVCSSYDFFTFHDAPHLSKSSSVSEPPDTPPNVRAGQAFTAHKQALQKARNEKRRDKINPGRKRKTSSAHTCWSCGKPKAGTGHTKRQGKWVCPEDPQ